MTPHTMGGRAGERIVFITLLLLFARHVWFASHVHPYADDFHYALHGVGESLWDRLALMYHIAHGRWASDLFLLNSPLRMGFDAGLAWYRAAAVLLMVLHIVAVRVLLQVVLPAWGGMRAWSLSLFALLLYMHLMPDAGEGYYWYTGAWTYQLASVLMLFHLANGIALARCEGPRAGHTLISVLLIPLISGCNETAMMLMVLAHGALVLLAFWKAPGSRVVAVVLLLVALLSAWFVWSSPGNVSRAGWFPEGGDMIKTAGMSLLQTARFGLIWTMKPAMLVGALLLWRWYDRQGTSISGIKDALGGWTWLLVAMPYLVLLATMVPPYWATGLLGQYRTVNVAAFWFMPLSAFALLALHQRHGRKLGGLVKRLDQIPSWALMAVLGALLLGYGRDGRATMDLLDGTAAAYDAATQERYRLIRTAVEAGENEVVLPPIDPMPRSITPVLPGPWPGYWVNRGMAVYFGLDSLAVPDTP